MNYRKSDYLLALVLSLFFICLAVVIAVFEPFIFKIDLEIYNLAGRSGLSGDTVLHNYNLLIGYQSFLAQGPLQLPDFVMSNSGLIHFVEVKHIFATVQIVALITSVFGVIGVIARIKEREYRFLNLTSYLMVIIPALVGVVAVGDFDRTFVFFHQLVFKNDYWLFDANTDPVIKILPQEFFYHKLVLIIVLIFVFAAALKIIYRHFKRKIIG